MATSYSVIFIEMSFHRKPPHTFQDFDYHKEQDKHRGEKKMIRQSRYTKPVCWQTV